MGESLSGVGVLDKAISILTALATGPAALSELSAQTDLPRATAHRLASALETHELVARDGTGRYVLGPGLARLAGSAGGARRKTIVEAATPALVNLRDQTGESVQLYVRSGESRVCVMSLESPHSLRTIVQVGATLPMDRGSAAKVLRCDADVLKRGWAESVEEREKGVASVSAPIIVDSEVVAAVSVSGPIDRTSRQPGRRYGAAVAESARQISGSLKPST
ncbi:MAG TPA: IclR family transcriptional regulator [Acidimicrobiales bacterium]